MMTEPQDLLSYFTALDWAALALLILAVAGTTYVVEHPPRNFPSTHRLMGLYRLEWMCEAAARDVRIFDAQVLASLRQGNSFFASATMIAIGGGVALLGQVDRLSGVLSDFDTGAAQPPVVWEAKILTMLILLALAFLKFVWSLRLFGYCAVLLAAVPNDGTTARAKSLASKAGQINVLADRSFTRALRSVYFALASLAWFLGPVPLICAILATVAIIGRREFASRTRRHLIEDRALAKREADADAG